MRGTAIGITNQPSSYTTMCKFQSYAERGTFALASAPIFARWIDSPKALIYHINTIYRENPVGALSVRNHLEFSWPSGLRRWIKAPISQGAWVRIPPGTWGMDEHAGRPDAALLLLLLWILNYSIARFPLVRVLLLRTVHTQKSSSFYAHTATHSDTRSQGRTTRGRGHILEGGHWGGHACFAGWGTAPAPPFHWR